MHKLSAATARRQDLSITERRYDLLYALFAMRNHRRDSAVFSTESHSSRRVDTNTDMEFAAFGKQGTADVADGTSVRNLPRIYNRTSALNQFFIRHGAGFDYAGFASKVRNHCWIGSVQGAVATW